MLLNAINLREIISLGTLPTILGIGIVFLMLVLLVFVVQYLPNVNKIDFEKYKFWKKFKKTSLITEITENNEINLNDNKNNDEIIVAITAAISMILSTEKVVSNQPRASFVVKSIKRI